MGCWNGTCGLTNLSVRAEDDVVFYLLKDGEFRNSLGFGTGVCYSNELFAPFGLPVYGKYNDYGTVEKIQNPEMAVKLVKAAKFDGTFEDMLSAIGENHRSDDNLAALGWKALRGYSTIMFHKFAVDLVIEHIKTERESSYIRFEEEIKSTSILNLIYCRYCTSEKFLLLLEEADRPELLKHKALEIGMNDLRKLWMPQGGAGSQGEETSVYKKLAQATVDHCLKVERMED